MRMHSKPILFLAFLASFVLFACNLPTAGNTAHGDVMFTQAAETLAVYLTQTQEAGLLTPQPTLTSTPFFPTETATTTPTDTKTPAAPEVNICDWAQYIKDVTVPDGTGFTPGAEFTKTWRLRNIGTCTWNSYYDLVFDEGDGMNGDASVPIDEVVYPGNTVDVSVDLVAPTEPGKYRGYYKLRNQHNAVFGIGGDADLPFWVDIKVLEPSSAKYDFAINYCAAEWDTGEEDDIPCPGSEGDNDGFVLLLTDPYLENRHENEPAIYTHPDYNDDGYIRGKYPAIKIKDGDHFRGWVGCLDDSPDCHVLFKLKYQIGSDPVETLGEWDEAYEGQVSKIDLDLSALDGEKVKFIFEVTVNGGKAKQANAFWFVPRIDD